MNHVLLTSFRLRILLNNICTLGLSLKFVILIGNYRLPCMLLDVTCVLLGETVNGSVEET